MCNKGLIICLDLDASISPVAILTDVSMQLTGLLLSACPFEQYYYSCFPVVTVRWDRQRGAVAWQQPVHMDSAMVCQLFPSSL